MDKNASNTHASKRPPYRTQICVGVAVAALAGVAGCGGGDDGSSDSTSSTTAGASAAATSAPAADAVTIKDFAYAPPSFTVNKGAAATFTNNDDTSHTATAEDGNAFDSGTIAAGKSAEVSFDSPGTFSYYCRFHPFMKGTVTVK